MIGFYVSSIKGQYDGPMMNGTDICHDVMFHNRYQIDRTTLNKFMEDKIFYQDEETIIVLEGVILNKNELCMQTSWPQFVKECFLQDGMSFVNQFRGPFSGAIYQKAHDKWTFFTSHIGYGSVFYCNTPEGWAVGSDYHRIASVANQTAGLNINEQAAYDMLTFGYMTADHTLIQGVQKLEAGHYLEWDGNQLVLKQYHSFRISKKEPAPSEEEMIDNLDRLFRRAVKRGFEKDREYGYKHIASLSGGLDSRLTIWVAADLGYTDNLVAIEFGKAGYLDEAIAKKVAHSLGIELIIKPIDDARFLLDYQEVVHDNFGLSIYPGTAHGHSMYKLLNFSSFGLMHTGDEQLFWYRSPDGDYSDTEEYRLQRAYSRTLSGKYTNSGRRFAHIWEFCMYTRGFMGNLNSANAKNRFITHNCPFLDVDFAEYVFSLPIDIWDNDDIYQKWYLSKYPKAAEIPVERYNGARINDSKLCYRYFQVKNLGLGGAWEVLLRRIGINKHTRPRFTQNSMNPLDYWYHERPGISNSMDAYTEKMIHVCSDKGLVTKELMQDMVELYKQGTVTEKTQVITVLAGIEEALNCSIH